MQDQKCIFMGNNSQTLNGQQRKREEVFLRCWIRKLFLQSAFSGLLTFWGVRFRQGSNNNSNNNGNNINNGSATVSNKEVHRKFLDMGNGSGGEF